MKFLVTPTFTEKLSSLATDGLPAIAAIVDFIKSVDKSALASGRSDVQVRMLDGSILTLKHGHYRIYASIGGDENEEYLLLLDIGVEQVQPMSKTDFFATKDPRRNPALDPNRNMTIDPRRNMTIDPHRNRMIDPNRNMMIDPRRNMMIDPNRNMMIDPRRNRYYGGPYLYDTRLNQEGFVVRANDKVSLLFDPSASFTGFVVATDSGNENVFDIRGAWIGFLVPTESDIRLRFGTNGEWVGVVV